MTQINRTAITDNEIKTLEERLGFKFKEELDPYLAVLGMDEPFWAIINRNCTKVRTRDLSTAGVIVERDGSFKFYWNPDFVGTLSSAQIRGLIIHEFMHLILEHVTTRRRKPHSLWNIATDLAINSMIDPKLLPKCGLYPGPRPKELGPWEAPVLPDPPEGEIRKPKRKMTTEEKDLNDHMMKLLETLTPKEAADYYFEVLINDPKVQEGMKGGTLEIILGNGGDDVNGIGNGMDDHDIWDDLDEDLKDMVREQIRDMVEQGIRRCDSNNQWGSVPSEMQQTLRDMIAGQVDWKALLRQFIGQSISCEKSNSIKRVNRKYPYIHPGRKRKYRAKVLVAIDQSGSVGDHNIEEMFGELNCLARHVDFTVMPFDTEVDEKCRIEWKRGQKKPTTRFRCGGTDFNAPTKFFNDRSGEWDALIIFSDGECSKPDPVFHGRRAYIIVPDRKLLFEPDPQDAVIQMTSDKRKHA